MAVYRRFVSAFALGVSACFTLYLGAFYFQFGAPIAAEWWIPGMRLVKADLASKAPPGSVLIASGSNSLFGMDSALLSRELGRPVVNLATHAALPLDQLMDTVRELAKAGDLVIMPLEWTYLVNDYQVLSDWAVTQTIAWNQPYFESLPARRKLAFFTSVSPLTVLENAIAKLRKNRIDAEHPGRHLEEADVVLAKFATGRKEGGYSYMNISSEGDILGTCDERDMGADNPFRYDLPLGASINPNSMRLVVETVQILHRRGVHVVMSFPPIAETAVTRGDAFQADLARLEQQLRSSGLVVVGTQRLFMFSHKDFYDSPYHLNCRARQDRTKRLAQALSPVLTAGLR